MQAPRAQDRGAVQIEVAVPQAQTPKPSEPVPVKPSAPQAAQPEVLAALPQVRRPLQVNEPPAIAPAPPVAIEPVKLPEPSVSPAPSEVKTITEAARVQPHSTVDLRPPEIARLPDVSERVAPNMKGFAPDARPDVSVQPELHAAVVQSGRDAPTVGEVSPNILRSSQANSASHAVTPEVPAPRAAVQPIGVGPASAASPRTVVGQTVQQTPRPDVTAPVAPNIQVAAALPRQQSQELSPAEQAASSEAKGLSESRRDTSQKSAANPGPASSEIAAAPTARPGEDSSASAPAVDLHRMVVSGPTAGADLRPDISKNATLAAGPQVTVSGAPARSGRMNMRSPHPPVVSLPSYRRVFGRAARRSTGQEMSPQDPCILRLVPPPSQSNLWPSHVPN